MATVRFDSSVQIRPEQIGVSVGHSRYDRVAINELLNFPGKIFRLHDVNGCIWKEIDLATGYDFSGMDIIMDKLKGMQISFTLMGTPNRFAKFPTLASSYSPGDNSPTNDPTVIYNFLKAMFRKYPGRINFLEAWNEVNIVGFWGGTKAELGEIVLQCRRAINDFNPTCKLLTPSLTRMGYGDASAVTVGSAEDPAVFFPLMVNQVTSSGLEVHHLCDGSAWHTYGHPERAWTTCLLAKTIVEASAMLRKPRYQTEMNYAIGSPNNAFAVQQWVRASVVPILSGFEHNILYNNGNPDLKIGYSMFGISQDRGLLAGGAATGNYDYAIEAYIIELNRIFSSRIKRMAIEDAVGGGGGVTLRYLNPNLTETVISY
jgi:hypothetical protein